MKTTTTQRTLSTWCLADSVINLSPWWVLSNMNLRETSLRASRVGPSLSHTDFLCSCCCCCCGCCCCCRSWRCCCCCCCSCFFDLFASCPDLGCMTRSLLISTVFISYLGMAVSFSSSSKSLCVCVCLHCSQIVFKFTMKKTRKDSLREGLEGGNNDKVKKKGVAAERPCHWWRRSRRGKGTPLSAVNRNRMWIDVPYIMSFF